MGKKTWTPFTEIEAAKFRAAGLFHAYGYFLLLRIAIGYDETLRTNVRALAALFGYSDLAAVARILKQLAEAGFISYEQNSRGTLIRVNEAFCGVMETRTLALGKPVHSVMETITPLPYDTKQHNNTNTARANNSGTLFDMPKEEQNSKGCGNGNGLKTSKKHDLKGLDKDAGTFRAELKEDAPPRQIFAKWYVFTAFPALYRTATKETTREWYIKRSKALDSVMRFAANDVELAKDVTLVRLEKLKKFSQREGEDIAPSLDNIAKHWEEDLRSVDAMRQKRARQEQFLRAEAARKEQEARELQQAEDEWWSLTEEEKTAELRRIAAGD